MKRLSLKIFVVVIPLAGFPSFGDDHSEAALALVVNNDQIKLVNGDMSVTTSPGMLSATFAGPYGNFSGYGFHHPLKEINVDADTAEKKRVSLVGQDDNFKYTLTLTARANSPGIEVSARSLNSGEYAGNRSCHYGLTKLKFPYYYDANGWQSAAKATLPRIEWLYLPSANTSGGYGLIPFNPETLRISTYFSRQANWEDVGLIVGARKRSVKPGETVAIAFSLFPANSRWQVLEQYEKQKNSQQEM